MCPLDLLSSGYSRVTEIWIWASKMACSGALFYSFPCISPRRHSYIATGTVLAAGFASYSLWTDCVCTSVPTIPEVPKPQQPQLCSSAARWALCCRSWEMTSAWEAALLHVFKGLPFWLDLRLPEYACSACTVPLWARASALSSALAESRRSTGVVTA